jgi:Domain of unknown function (DUF5050)/Secretion system C-terminal sorting domain
MKKVLSQILFTTVFISNILAQSATKLFFVSDYGFVARCDLDGNAYEVLYEDLTYPKFYGIAVDHVNGLIFWTDNSNRSIYKSSLDGTNKTEIYSDPSSDIVDITLDIPKKEIYWTDKDYDNIQRTTYDGTYVETVVSGLTTPYGIAIDAAGGKIYWVDTGTNKIQRANLDGTNIQDLATSSDPLRIALDIDNNTMYWTDDEFPSIPPRNKIYGAALDGSNRYVLVDFLAEPHAIAINNSADQLYWSDTFDNKITRMNLVGNPLTTDILTFVPNVTGIALDYNPTQLPVELTSFTVLKMNDVVKLNWQTATEVNNYGFEIERHSVTQIASNLSNKWEKVGFIEGHGNSNSPKLYSFTDIPTGGTNFSYRLKQIDIDGKFTYSDIVEVEVIPENYELSQNYPNPFNPSTTISYKIPEDSFVELKVYDILGKEVAALVNKREKAGNYKVTFDTQNIAGKHLTSGIYFTRLNSGSYTGLIKMLLIK